jgi:hypothetical protein
MATLSGNTIQSTYQGLLKLNNSTSGITSSFQDITDGLGNPTGMQLKEDNLLTPNHLFQPSYKFKYYGPGWGGTNYTPSTTSVADIFRTQFSYYYDPGLHSYSGMSVYLNTSSGVNDEYYKFAIYDTQFDPEIGILPYNRLTDVIFLDVSGSTGVQYIPFTTPVSIPAGFYFVVSQVFNNTTPAALPVSRYRVGNSQTGVFATQQIMGITNWYQSLFDGDRYFNPFGTISSTTNSFPIFQNVGFPSQYTIPDLTTGRISAAASSSNFGFILHTIF